MSGEEQVLPRFGDEPIDRFSQRFAARPAFDPAGHLVDHDPGAGCGPCVAEYFREMRESLPDESALVAACLTGVMVLARSNENAALAVVRAIRGAAFTRDGGQVE